MGSTPTINAKNKQKQISQKEIIENQQFKNSIEHMKFSKRNDLFKQKSQQAQFQINIALQSLKKNQLLTTGQFAKLRKTQITRKNNRQSLILAKDRYQYNKNGNKKNSETNIQSTKRLKSQQSKNNFSISSTLIQKSVVDSFISDQLDIKDIQMIKRDIQMTKKQIQAKTQRKIQNNVIQHLKNRKKKIISIINPINKNEKSQILIPIQEINQINYQNGKFKQNINKKKNKNIKSQKFIPHQIVFLNDQKQTISQQKKSIIQGISFHQI